MQKLLFTIKAFLYHFLGGQKLDSTMASPRYFLNTSGESVTIEADPAATELLTYNGHAPIQKVKLKHLESAYIKNNYAIYTSESGKPISGFYAFSFKDVQKARRQFKTNRAV